MRIQIYLDWEDKSSGERLGDSIGLSIGPLTPAQSGEFRPHAGLHAGRETCLKKNKMFWTQMGEIVVQKCELHI